MKAKLPREFGPKEKLKKRKPTGVMQL